MTFYSSALGCFISLTNVCVTAVESTCRLYFFYIFGFVITDSFQVPNGKMHENTREIA